MATRVDARVWNLLVGSSLIAGACSERTAGDDTTTASDTGDGDGDGDGDGYNDYGDGDGYNDSYSEEWSAYECYTADDCGPFELCETHDCVEVPQFPACTPTTQPSIPLVVDGETLALSFVDLDADGAAELVAATQTQLHAFESGSDVATVSARVSESPSVAAMVAGDFDPAPGQDLALLVDDTVFVHSADGIAGFDAPSADESPQDNSIGMLAGDVDGVPPTDLVIWGQWTSVIGASVWVLDAPPIESATAHDLSSGSGRFVLRDESTLYFYSLDGFLSLETAINPGAAAFVTAITHPEHLDANVTVYDTWSLFQLWEPGNLRGQWGVLGSISAIASGDLDGDGHDEVPLIRSGGVTLVGNFENGNKCSTTFEFGGLGEATHIAVGDWDGDGDGELAIAFTTNELVVFDGEG